MSQRVSVICTFRNAEATLQATLASLRRQTAAEASFILVDDGSTDGCAAIAEHAATTDGRFSFYRNPHPGRGHALNLAVAKANSEFVAILDADDLAHPRWLEDGIAAMEREPGFVVIGFQQLYIRGDERADWTLADEQVLPEIRNVTRGLAKANVVGHSGAIIRRAPLVGLGAYDADRKSLFDYDLWIRFAQSGRQVGLARSIRIAKRYHDGQKFAHSKGYSLAAWKVQFRALMVLDRDYRNFLLLALRVVRDTAREARRSLALSFNRH